MKDRSKGKTRSDRPSGRQASVQPEHGGGSEPATESLHQGQGPDFQTQDRRMQEKNKGLEQMEKGATKGNQKGKPSNETDINLQQIERMDTQNMETDGE